jgi:DNA repair exonuclease SbcCD ATPase subunit
MIKSVIINNFGPLENVQFDCKKFNILQGRNNQGKTSILEAIKWCIVGGNDEFLVRNGTSTCEVILVSDKGSRIERRLTRGGTSKLYIYGADEKPVKEPQNVLNKLHNPLLFGPTDMLRMKAKDLNEFISTTISKRLKLSDKEIEEYGLKDKVNLDEDPVGEIQKFYDELFKERTEVNRAVKNFESKSSGAELVKQVTDAELEAMEKLVAQTEADLSSAKEKNIRLDISRKNADIKSRTEANIKLLKKELEDGMVVLEQLDESAKELTTLVTEKERLEKELDKDRAELANIKATLDKLGTGEIACPINALIKCTTDMKPYKEQLEKAQDKIKTAGKAKYTKTTELNEKIINIRSAIETGKNLKSKKLELDRAESILGELEILDGDIVDVTGLETSLKQMKDELYKARLSKDISKISGIDDTRKRQDELNKQLEKLNVLLKEVIPSRLTLNVKNVTLGKEGLFFQGLPFYRLADSLKLRLCTAVLKDLFVNANLYTLDKLETIDKVELEKYITYYANEKNGVQYFGTYVGTLNPMNNANISLINMNAFKIG